MPDNKEIIEELKELRDAYHKEKGSRLRKELEEKFKKWEDQVPYAELYTPKSYYILTTDNRTVYSAPTIYPSATWITNNIYKNYVN